jgi:hypothetical protein
LQKLNDKCSMLCIGREQLYLCKYSYNSCLEQVEVSKDSEYLCTLQHQKSKIYSIEIFLNKGDVAEWLNRWLCAHIHDVVSSTR